MNELIQDYIAGNGTHVTVEMTTREYEGLATEVVKELTGVDISDYISSGLLSDDYNRIGTFVDRVLLTPEEEEAIDVLYQNPFGYYVEPSEILTNNIITHLFNQEIGVIGMVGFDYFENYRYRLLIPYHVYREHSEMELSFV